jgi:hypothetical protein
MEKKDKKKREITPIQKKSMWSFFTLLFPSLLITVILTFDRSMEFVIIGILLFFNQAVLLKNFIEKFYQDF